MYSSIASFLQKHRAFLYDLPPLWVDGGAYKGEFLDACLAFRHDVQLVAFEPQPHRARKLKKKYRHLVNVDIYAQALGDHDAMTTLHITTANTLSFTCFPAPVLSSKVQERYIVLETVQVEQVCLQSVLKTPPGLVKLDIQGSELHAIKGLGDVLPRTAALLVERSTRQRYPGQPSDAELHFFIEEAGFMLKDILPHIPQEGIEVFDALYGRNI